MSSIAKKQVEDSADSNIGKFRYPVYFSSVLLLLLVIISSYLLSRYQIAREVDSSAAVLNSQMQALLDSGGNFSSADHLRAFSGTEGILGLVVCVGGRAYSYQEAVPVDPNSFCGRRFAAEFNGSLMPTRGLISNRFWANYYLANKVSPDSNFWILYKVPSSYLLTNAAVGLLILLSAGVFFTRVVARITGKYAEDFDREVELRINERSERLLQMNYDLQMEVEKSVALRKEAEAKNQAKQNYLSTMSHEIRTPLNGMIGTVEVLMKTSLSKKQQRLLNRINRASGALLELINGILDIGKIESGKFELEEKTFCLTELVSDSIELYLETAEKKGIELGLEISDEFPSYLVGDPQRIYQILNNLLSNAIKFSDRGVVRVKLTGAPGAKGMFDFRLSVKDTGIGIDKDRQADLFNRFTQADVSVSREYGGSGLGLSICKTLVEMMAGDIGLASEKGKGSEFTVSLTLPIAESTALPVSIRPEALLEEMGESDSNDQGGLLAGGKVLVVEDTEVNQQVVYEMLSIMGVAYEGVENGEEAVAACEKETYICILMDCHMPRMNGYEATRCIRELERESGGHTPIIALTANAIAGEREKCLAAGMDDFLAKPFTFDGLQRMLRQWIPADRSEPQPEVEAEPVACANSPPETAAGGNEDVSVDDHIDVLVIESIFDLQQKAGSDLLHRMVNNYFTSAPDLLRELKSTVDSADWDDVRLLAHKLKSASVNVGLIQVGEKAHNLEHAEDLQAADVQPLLGEVEREIDLCHKLMQERVIPILR